MPSAEANAREALRQFREFFEEPTGDFGKAVWPAICEAAGAVGLDLSDERVRKSFLVAVSLIELAMQTNDSTDAQAALSTIRVALLEAFLWPENLHDTCGMCGATPAEGTARVNGVRYCHPDFATEPTCYERASWRAVPTLDTPAPGE